MGYVIRIGRVNHFLNLAINWLNAFQFLKHLVVFMAQSSLQNWCFRLLKHLLLLLLLLNVELLRNWWANFKIWVNCSNHISETWMHSPILNMNSLIDFRLRIDVFVHNSCHYLDLWSLSWKSRQYFAKKSHFDKLTIW